MPWQFPDKLRFGEHVDLYPSLILLQKLRWRPSHPNRQFFLDRSSQSYFPPSFWRDLELPGISHSWEFMFQCRGKFWPHSNQIP